MLLAMLLCLRAAHADDSGVWIGALLSGGAAIGPTGGGGSGQVLAGVSLGHTPGRAIGLEARVGEGVYAPAVRTVGTVDLDVRYPAGTGPYGLIGFAHHHELGLDAMLAHPVGGLSATYSGITHRTGFELGAGWDAAPPLPQWSFTRRLRPTARVTVTVLPDGVAPSVYVMAHVGVLLGLGPAR